MKVLTTLLTCFVFLLSCAGQGSWKKIKEELILINPPFKECHASTIAEVSQGKLVAAWFGGTQERAKDVEIWMSRLENGKWNKPVSVANGIINDTLRYPCWNPVLFKDKNDTLHLFYKVGPNPREWWGMEIVSVDNGETWSKPQRLPDGILGPIKNKPVQLADGVILSPSSTEANNGKWKAHIERSANGGTSWELIPIDTAGAFDVIQPSVLHYKDGRLQVVCRSKQGHIIQAWSDDEGKTWGKLTPLALFNPNSGIDAVTLKNGIQLIVYNPQTPGKEWFNGRAKLNVAVSEDGLLWKDIVILENGTSQEYSYPAVIQTQDGKVHITYTYDRKNIKHVVLEQAN